MNIKETKQVDDLVIEFTDMLTIIDSMNIKALPLNYIDNINVLFYRIVSEFKYNSTELKSVELSCIFSLTCKCKSISKLLRVILLQLNNVNCVTSFDINIYNIVKLCILSYIRKYKEVIFFNKLQYSLNF